MHKLDLNDSAESQPTAHTQTEPKNSLDETHSIDQNQESKLNLELNLQEEAPMKKKGKTILIVLSLLAVAAGTATGYGGYRLQQQSGDTAGGSQEIQQVAQGSVKKGDVFGVKDEATFKDSAQGYLEAGGLNGEGSHKLLRPGGVSQTVYLTSSVTDLDKLVGIEVKVWGETFKGQEAGWLMDVGRVEVINPQAEPPVEAE